MIPAASNIATSPFSHRAFLAGVAHLGPGGAAAELAAPERASGDLAVRTNAANICAEGNRRFIGAILVDEGFGDPDHAADDGARRQAGRAAWADMPANAARRPAAI